MKKMSFLGYKTVNVSLVQHDNVGSLTAVMWWSVMIVPLGEHE